MYPLPVRSHIHPRVCSRQGADAAGPVSEPTQHRAVPRLPQPPPPADPQHEPQPHLSPPLQGLRGPRHPRDTHPLREQGLQRRGRRLQGPR